MNTSCHIPIDPKELPTNDEWWDGREGGWAVHKEVIADLLRDTLG